MPIFNVDGWSPDYDEIEKVCDKLPIRMFGQAAPELKDTGVGETNLLYEKLLQIRGSWPYYTQQLGDCVAHAGARAIMLLMAAEIVSGDKEIYAGDISSEDLYGGSRVEIGRGQLGSSDGSIGAWLVEYISKYGVLTRKLYNSIDLRNYDPSLAKKWGNSGVPNELEEFSRDHTVHGFNQVASYEEARDAINNDHPVIVCSNQGFRDVRDRHGYGIANGQWMHAMLFVACHDGKRPALICDNTSWPKNWISGPKPEWAQTMPDGMFPVDAEIADRMLRQGDSYSIYDFNGYKRKKIKLGSLSI